MAALEMVLYPKSSAVIANSLLAAAGTIELVPVNPPSTLLVWGALRVLSYDDLPITEAGHHIFLVHQVAKEALATAGAVEGQAVAAAPRAVRP